MIDNRMRKKGALEKLPKDVGEINPRGAYLVIAKALGLEPVQGRPRIFESPTAQRYVLTKFGFESVESFNWRVMYDNLYKDCDKLKYKAAEWDKNVESSKYALHLQRQVEQLKKKARDSENNRKKEMWKLHKVLANRKKKFDEKTANLIIIMKSVGQKATELRKREMKQLQDVVEYCIKKKIIPKSLKADILMCKKLTELDLP